MQAQIAGAPKYSPGRTVLAEIVDTKSTTKHSSVKNRLFIHIYQHFGLITDFHSLNRRNNKTEPNAAQSTVESQKSTIYKSACGRLFLLPCADGKHELARCATHVHLWKNCTEKKPVQLIKVFC